MASVDSGYQGQSPCLAEKAPDESYQVTKTAHRLTIIRVTQTGGGNRDRKAPSRLSERSAIASRGRAGIIFFLNTRRKGGRLLQERKGARTRSARDLNSNK